MAAIERERKLQRINVVFGTPKWPNFVISCDFELLLSWLTLLCCRAIPSAEIVENMFFLFLKTFFGHLPTNTRHQKKNLFVKIATFEPRTRALSVIDRQEAWCHSLRHYLPYTAHNISVNFGSPVSKESRLETNTRNWQNLPYKEAQCHHMV
jgi:hypothetical protein